jgi:TonB-linked SusC/RagA family outer membrane protein
MGLTRTANVGLNTGSNSLSGNVANATALFPNVPVRNPDGSFNISPDGVRLGQGENLLPMAYNYPNIAFVLANNKNNATNYRILGNAYAEASVTDGLKLRTQIGVDAFLNDDYIYWDPRHGDGRGLNGYVFQGFAPTVRWNWQNTVNYNRVIGQDHNINFVAGVEYQKETSRYYQAQASDLADPFFGQNNIVSNTFSTPNVDGGITQSGFDSYFGRINYAFKDRYLFSFTVRNDGISSLPKANRRGTFPGGSIGWRVSEEGFFEGLKQYIPNLKLRASYAVVGNVDIGDFPYSGTYASAQYGSQNGIAFSSVSNPDLRWESSKKFDFGVDLGLFNDRLSVTVDYYRNDADDLILFTPTAFSVGIPGNTTIGTAYNGINQNVGSLFNTGVEIDVTARVIERGGFTWSVNTNFATNRNEITALNNNEDIVNTYNITRVGESIGAIYGFTYAGVNAANGNPLYVKGNGQVIQGNLANNRYFVYNPENPTELTEAATLSATEDRSVLGVSNPRWFGGVSNNFTYKGFDLNIFARFSGGNKIMNVTQQNLLRMDFQNNGSEILNRWQSPENPGDGQVPQLQAGNSTFINQEGFALSRFVEKGDFLRIQNITLGYSVPANLLQRLSLSRVRVFAQVQNAFTFTGYSGLDPEINLNSDGGTLASRSRANNQFGIDFNGNPPARIITFGLNLGL